MNSQFSNKKIRKIGNTNDSYCDLWCRHINLYFHIFLIFNLLFYYSSLKAQLWIWMNFFVSKRRVMCWNTRYLFWQEVKILFSLLGRKFRNTSFSISHNIPSVDFNMYPILSKHLNIIFFGFFIILKLKKIVFNSKKMLIFGHDI